MNVQLKLMSRHDVSRKTVYRPGRKGRKGRDKTAIKIICRRRKKYDEGQGTSLAWSVADSCGWVDVGGGVGSCNKSWDTVVVLVVFAKAYTGFRLLRLPLTSASAYVDPGTKIQNFNS